MSSKIPPVLKLVWIDNFSASLYDEHILNIGGIMVRPFENLAEKTMFDRLANEAIYDFHVQVITRDQAERIIGYVRGYARCYDQTNPPGYKENLLFRVRMGDLYEAYRYWWCRDVNGGY